MKTESMKKTFATVFLVALAVAGAGAEIVEQIVVKVNGEILTKTELEQRQVAAIRAKNRGTNQIDLRNDEQLKQAIAEVTPQLIVEAVDEMLILQQGKEHGYKLSDDQFNNIVERIRKENKLDDQEKFEAALKQEGMTMADLRRNLERQMIASRVQSDIVGKISVTDEEARQYFDAHRNEFTTPSSLTLREILVEVPTTTQGGSGQPSFNAAADDEAREKAEALRRRTVGGEDFAKLAAAESNAASKANGGLVGPLNHEELAESLQKLVDPLKVGEVSEIVRTPRGYQFFKLESLTPAAVRPFEQAREDIVNKVYADRRNAEFQKQLRKMRDLAIIEWKNEELRKIYEKQIQTDAAATTPTS
jgi:peptidyl-prolyl cis-trans isomerase SurA